jgi:hypothetical protein
MRGSRYSKLDSECEVVRAPLNQRARKISIKLSPINATKAE